MKLKQLLTIGGLLSLSLSGFAQWECPSRLGSQLKPIGSSDYSWANEITSTAGILGDYKIGNLMDYVGIDYTHENHTFYFEGGVKTWVRVDSTGQENQLIIPGLRELFYRYQTDENTLTIGEQTAKSDDYYLLNERIVGLNYNYKNNGWNLNLIGGSVIKEFARNGTFCTLGYLYNVIPGRQRAILGRVPGQTNLTMLTLSFKPGERNQNSGKSDGLSEFSSDEFRSGSTDKAAKSKPWFPVNSIGAVAYTEYGPWVFENLYIGGLYADFGISNWLTLKPEVLYQNAKDNNALIYSITAEKQIDWGTQMTKAFARYIGMKAFDSNAIALNSYSNVFAGEVIRLDALELPFFQAGLKHSFSKIKTSIKLQAALQTVDGSLTPMDLSLGKEGKRMSEYDVVIGKNFGKYFLVNATMGYLKYYYLAHNHITETDSYANYDSLFGKIEVRLTF